MIRRSIFLALSMCALSACPVVTDLGATCRLVKKDPADTTGKRSMPMVESEIKPGRDFISFGAVECDDLTCVRDSYYVKDPATKDTDPALGYCSRPCLQTAANACPAQNPADDSSALKRLSCRPLILDEATLNFICQTDPTTCRKYFGDTKSPYFCARGTTDAGS
ncbi:MAG: adventurous gliding motility lipoprotein CglC [Myxococcaceae bacterium]